MGGKYKGKSREEIFQERISALEKSLAMERLRNRALEKLIETAEREEGVSIKKVVSGSRGATRGVSV